MFSFSIRSLFGLDLPKPISRERHLEDQRRLVDSIVNRLTDYFSVDREEELRNATWEEIDATAEKLHGEKPTLKRGDDRVSYAGSAYIANDSIGSLDESNARWEQLGNP